MDDDIDPGQILTSFAFCGLEETTGLTTNVLDEHGGAEQP